MFAKKIILCIALLLAPSLISAQNINCIFTVTGQHYDCTLNNLNIPIDNEQTVFTIQGTHQPSRNNNDVTRVVIINSQINFVIAQFFTTFPNLQQYIYQNSASPTRVQNLAFQGANNLLQITISNTAGLTLFPNSFSGLNLLQTLNLPQNLLTGLPQGALNGLSNLTAIDLSNNQMTAIGELILRNQPQLATINLNNNQITRLPNTLLQTNTNLITFQAQSNQIYQIGRRFLEFVGSLTSLQLQNNLCVSQNWNGIGVVGGPTKDQINTVLEPCFGNYTGGSGAEWRNFGFRLRGNVRLWDEDDNFVGQLTG